MSKFDDSTVELTRDKLVEEAEKYLACCHSWKCDGECSQCPNTMDITLTTLVRSMKELIKEGN